MQIWGNLSIKAKFRDFIVKKWIKAIKKWNKKNKFKEIEIKFIISIVDSETEELVYDIKE